VNYVRVFVPFIFTDSAGTARPLSGTLLGLCNLLLSADIAEYRIIGNNAVAFNTFHKNNTSVILPIIEGSHEIPKNSAFCA